MKSERRNGKQKTGNCQGSAQGDDRWKLVPPFLRREFVKLEEFTNLEPHSNDAMNQETDHAAELVITATSILGDKWLVFIVHQLLHGPKRHGELRRAVPGITQRMLTRTLQKMEAHGLLTRTVLKEKPLAVQYGLTSKGHTLRAPLTAMAEWSEKLAL